MIAPLKGVGTIPLHLNEELHQGGTRKLLHKKTNERHEARLSDISPSFRDKKVVPLHHFVSAPHINIRG